MTSSGHPAVVLTCRGRRPRKRGRRSRWRTGRWTSWRWSSSLWQQKTSFSLVETELGSVLEQFPAQPTDGTSSHTEGRPPTEWRWYSSFLRTERQSQSQKCGPLAHHSVINCYQEPQRIDRKLQMNTFGMWLFKFSPSYILVTSGHMLSCEQSKVQCSPLLWFLFHFLFSYML